MKTIGANDLLNYTKRRTEIEIQLAKSMYDLYNTEPIIDDLRKIVGMAVENLVGWENKKHPYVGTAFKDEHNLAVWKDQPTTGAGLHNVWKRRNTWTASECSDLLRLFGTVIEFSHGKQGVGSKEHAAARVGGNARFKNIGDKDAPGRTRIGKGQTETATHYKAPAPYISAGRDVIPSVKMGGKFYGIMLYRLMPRSTIRKIDIAFGLPEGADISGTTADSLFGMGRVLNFLESAQLTMSIATPVPFLKLLPLVTMVSAGHHTMVESAAVLTLNKVIDYSIGSYTTLLPSHVKKGTAMEAISKLAFDAENNTDNAPVLAFWDAARRAPSGYLFGKNNLEEMIKFKKLARVSEEFLTHFKYNVSPQVTRAEIHRLMDRPDVRLPH